MLCLLIALPRIAINTTIGPPRAIIILIPARVGPDLIMVTKQFIKENWFKLGILLVLAIMALSVSIYLVGKNNIEQEKIEQDKKGQFESDLKLLQKVQSQESIDNCIKDAYTELKTLQGNFDSGTIVFCLNNKTGCSTWREGNEKSKKEAFERYENEWVPQCKLGNRVFLDYKYCSPKDMMAEQCEE